MKSSITKKYRQRTPSRVQKQHKTKRKTVSKISILRNEPITKIVVSRTPIGPAIDKVISLASAGKWDELKEKYGYNKLFHLYLICYLQNGKILVLEKRDVIMLHNKIPRKNETETMEVPMGQQEGVLTINDLLHNCRNIKKDDRGFFHYDAFGNANCQTFVLDCLESSNISTSNVKHFIFQDLSEIGKELPWFTKKLINAATDLRAWYSKLMGRECLMMHNTKRIRRTAGKTKRVKHGGKYFCDDLLVDVAFNNKVNPIISSYNIESTETRQRILSGLRNLIKSSEDRLITAVNVNNVLNNGGITYASSVDKLVVALNDFKQNQYKSCTNNSSGNDSSPPNKQSPRESKPTPINWGNNIQTIKVDTNAVNDAKQQLEKNKEKEKCKSSGPFWRKTNQNDIKQCLQKGPGGFTFTEDEINETINEYVATTTE